MISIVRAAGFAAAALALAATSTFSAPSIASEADAAAITSPLEAHAEATIDEAGNEQALESLADNMVKFADAAVPRPRTLAELVAAHSRDSIAPGEMECLAGAVYFEARSEPLEGQLAVAEVVLNRSTSGKYPAGICDVVTQRKQFSFIVEGEFPPIDKTTKSWRKAVAIATIAFEDLAEEVPSTSLWYHADYVAPVWRHGLARAEKIGAHIFYTAKAKKA